MGTFATTTGLQVKMVGTNFDAATNSLAAACILDAENEIRKQLGDQYDTSADYFQTSTSCPPIIRTMCENLAIGYMYENLSRGGKEGYQRADRYIKRVMDNLKSLADGTLALVDTAGSQIVPTKTKWQVKNNTSGYAPTFDEDNPQNWRIDSTKLEDIADGRGTSTGDNDEID